MYIYEVVTCFGENTRIITEDVNMVLDKLPTCIGDCNIQVIIWNNGKEVFSTKSYDDEDFEYDKIYVELMSFLQKISCEKSCDNNLK